MPITAIGRTKKPRIKAIPNEIEAVRMRPGEIEPRNRRWKKCVTLLDSKCLTQKAPYKGLDADSEEKHEPASDIDTAIVDGLKALDPDRPIREAEIPSCLFQSPSPD